MPSMTVDGDTRPTWGFVVVLVLTLAAETFLDWVARPEMPPPDYLACSGFCDGDVAAVGPGSCECQRVLFELEQAAGRP